MASDVALGNVGLGSPIGGEVSSHADSRMPVTNVWDRRYSKEGFIWGKGPGPVAPILVGIFESSAEQRTLSILDFGCGYGRSALYFAQREFNVCGIDDSMEAINLAARLQRELNGSVKGSATFQRGGIEICKRFADESFDAVFSHRTLHLLDARQVFHFARQAARLLPANGILCISARAPEDFNPAQMQWVEGHENSTATYRSDVFADRAGHRINFWGRDRFEKIFGRFFEISSVNPDVEQEAQNNTSVYARLNTMIAKRRGASITGETARSISDSFADPAFVTVGPGPGRGSTLRADGDTVTVSDGPR